MGINFEDQHGTGEVNGFRIRPYANLSGGLNFKGANLQGARLHGANLSGSNFEGALFSLANLQGANLRGADLRGADLYGAHLLGADLTGADLTGANLIGANFALATVDPSHVQLIYAAQRKLTDELKVNAGRTPNPGYGYNYEEDPYDDAAGGFGYGRVMNPGHRHHRRGYGR